MFSIAFWNVADATCGHDPIVGFASSVAGDATLSGPGAECLICLAEPGLLDPAVLVGQLVAADGRPWWAQRTLSGRFVILGTLPQASLQMHSEAGGAFPCTLNRVFNGSAFALEVCFVHLSAPVGDWSPSDYQTITATHLRDAIEDHESVTSNGRTVLIGDFNMRPYDSAMLSPLGMHAAPCKASAVKPRVIQGKSYSYFYNPMWELLGNWTATRQPGTFYKRNVTDSLRWHLIDQILVRPAIADLLNGAPRIFAAAGMTRLVRATGVINSSISDHLPVAASLNA